ncbi:MAG: hypothetical protein JSW60_01320 [Thermoplasmatales archaeon]|nr:MAG: hypothetical protein JSW60_01320 [Thermoplasmatales archaeon]
MKINNKQKIRLHIILIIFLLSSVVIIATTPLHEAAHWIMSDIDPYSKPVEIHLFDGKYFQNGQHILSSALGCIIVKERYPGSFKDRPLWVDPIQELICISIQIILTCIIVSKTLSLLMSKKPNF